jgi:hypothetical protein
VRALRIVVRGTGPRLPAACLNPGWDGGESAGDARPVDAEAKEYEVADALDDCLEWGRAAPGRLV